MISLPEHLVYARVMLNHLETSILVTLAYYNALRWPLTALEVMQRRAPLRRERSSVEIGAIIAALDQLVVRGSVKTQSGLYWIGSMQDDVVANRITREALSADAWPSVLRSAWWLQAVPMVRMISGSGSLAMGSSGMSSDWDVFVVVEHGRLYTARFGLLVAAFLLGRLRTKEMRTAPHRFCFNHIITADSLALKHRSIFTAHVIAWLVPMYDPWRYAARLRDANRWTGEYVADSSTTVFNRRSVKHSSLLHGIRRSLELVIGTWIGALIERILRFWMQQRINNDPSTSAMGGRIVATDRELEFHPRSFEGVALRRFNSTLRGLGLGAYAQHDSGLR